MGIRILFLLTLLTFTTPVFADQPQMEALEAVVDLDTHTLVLHGRNFDNGNFLEVTLGGVGLLPVVTKSSSELELLLPEGLLPGTYTLVISTGGGTIRLDEIDLSIGLAGPPGPQGEPGLDGSNGSDGSEGSSCTASPIDGGAEISCGTTTATILNGANGSDGAQGIQGPAGPPGPEGPAGPQGPAGVIACEFEARIKAAVPSFELSEGCDDGEPPPPPNPGAAVGIFVSPAGNDANPGTIALPVKTVSKGIELAAALTTDRNVNLLASPPYYDSDTLTLPDGVNLIGGYNADWTGNGVKHSVINVYRPTGLIANGLTTPTKIEGVEIQAGSASEIGESSYGVIVLNSTALTINRSKIRAGSAGHGQNGRDGSGVAQDGGVGSSGQNGCEDSTFLCASCSMPTPGNGASGVNGGGIGGSPGHGTGNGSDGAPGQGLGAGFGGAGGFGSSNGGRGVDGLPGARGSLGNGGVQQFSANLYAPLNGLAGGTGGSGAGGGGGGGGGGGSANCDSYGGAGGGGGSGGSGGYGGTGGTSAGGSFALYLVDSKVDVTSSELFTGTGGNGGRGGEGSSGGTGGNGGAGGWGEDDSGAGGAGGKGGDGGAGGHGGGGAGGPTIGILLAGTSTVNDSGCTFNLGVAGSGGSSPGNYGSNGVRQNIYTVP